MHLLGKVERVSASGKLILRVSGKVNLRIGKKVFLKGKKMVGRVFDVVGPVSNPWVLVEPTGLEARSLLGKKLYLGD